jgi:hypothetical protein
VTLDGLPTFTFVPAALGGAVTGAQMLTHNPGNAATGGVWRVRGAAGSAVVKVARPPSPGSGAPWWQTSDDPAHWNYWRRESLAYDTGFAARVYAGSGIESAGFLGQAQRPDGSIELWLSDMEGSAGFSLSPSRLGAFARQLGVAQARWAGRVPEEPWLSRGWLAQYLSAGPATGVTAGGDEFWDHPATRTLPAVTRARLRALWEGRERLVAAAEAAPRTLCHLDVWPANLVARGSAGADGVTVLLDWTFVGEGALGEDAANLIVDSVTDGLMPAGLLPEIEAEVTDGYLEGLRAAGWAGSEDEVRRAIAICGAAKYSWFAPSRLGAAIRGGRSRGAYGGDDSAVAGLARLAGLLELLARWSDVLNG